MHACMHCGIGHTELVGCSGVLILPLSHNEICLDPSDASSYLEVTWLQEHIARYKPTYPVGLTIHGSAPL